MKLKDYLEVLGEAACIIIMAVGASFVVIALMIGAGIP
jgi:hypothetical protein